MGQVVLQDLDLTVQVSELAQDDACLFGAPGRGPAEVFVVECGGDALQQQGEGVLVLSVAFELLHLFHPLSVVAALYSPLPAVVGGTLPRPDDRAGTGDGGQCRSPAEPAAGIADPAFGRRITIAQEVRHDDR